MCCKTLETIISKIYEIIMYVPNNSSFEKYSEYSRKEFHSKKELFEQILQLFFQKNKKIAQHEKRIGNTILYTRTILRSTRPNSLPPDWDV